MTSSRILLICFAVLAEGATGLAGGLIPSTFLHKHLTALLSLAAGVLLGTAFLDLLPEALESLGTSTDSHSILFVMAAALVGFLVFFIVEHFLGSHAAGQKGHKHDHTGGLILIGDALHNITDGLAITAAFLVDIRTGALTTLTVILHELPQEVADYTILLSRGWSQTRALIGLFLVQLSAFIGVAIALKLSSAEWKFTPYILSFSAGGFIYIAAADLLPEIQRASEDTPHNSKHWIRLAYFVLGILIMGALSY